MRKRKSNSPPPKRSTPDALRQNADAAPKNTGRVQFDDRGNAVWQWLVGTSKFDGELSSEQIKKLEHPSLAIADETPAPAGAANRNPLSTAKGYNPYESGQLAGKGGRCKKDLRRLGEWIALRKQAAGNKKDDD